jgi:hypothetical protein
MPAYVLFSRTLPLSLLLFSGAGAAVSDPENFLVNNTRDLVELCSTAPDDPLYVAAIHFCNGFVVGAYHFHEAWFAGPDAQPLVCPPSPRPTRQQAIADFLAWSKNHPEHDRAPAVETLFRFLTETWPCPAGQAPGSGIGARPGRFYQK